MFWLLTLSYLTGGTDPDLGAVAATITVSAAEDTLSTPLLCPTHVSELVSEKWSNPAAYLRLDDPRLTSENLIVILKSHRRIMSFDDGEITNLSDGSPACWAVGLGYMGYIGHKQQEGDRRTPEGWYRTSDKPWSQFYGAIAIHYPNNTDAQAAVDDGRITLAQQRQIRNRLATDAKPPQNTALGGEILIHGGGSETDWTLGCVAMNNADLDNIRRSLPTDMKTHVLILP